MKVTAVLATAILAATTYGAAVPDAEADPNCWRPGMSCSKRRDAEANPNCWRPGMSCSKRSPFDPRALEFEERSLDSLVQRSCGMPGQPCNKLARAAEAAAEALAGPSAEADPHAELYIRNCWRPGMSCSKAKRSAEALAEAIAKAYADAFPDPEAFAEACSFGDAICEKIKRAAEMEKRNCWRPGMSCSKEKREAWAEAGAALDKRNCWRPGMSCS